ncbi:hypothetical protein WBG06_06280 [Nocardioides sp. CCNWLW239]|uniref:hypothetical protein n=1 Tax=Nocardioides sp. CCNWLW239 TaxID=3128902 RepID=UPI003016B559
MPGTGEWIAEGRFFDVTIFSDVAARDGLGWELADVAPTQGRGQVFEVFREDSGEVPTVSASSFEPVPVSLIERFVKAAVLDLLEGVVLDDGTDWLPTNVAAFLSLSGRRVSRWSGPEWPLSERADGTADLYAEEAAAAVPFAWLALALDVGEAEVGVYQDDAYFGLHIAQASKGVLSDYDPAYFRIHERADLPTGLIESVTVTLDTTVMDDPGTDAVVAEVFLTVDGQLVPLLAGEAYGPDEWHRLDESVVVLRDLAALDRINWLPARPRAPELFRAKGSG